MGKLQVPAPGQKPVDSTELDDTLFYSLMLCVILVVLGYFFWIAGDDEVEIEGQESAQAVHLSQAQEAQDLNEFAAMSEEELKAHRWDEAGLVQVMQHGPGEAADVACEHLKPRLESGEVGRQVHLAMLESVTRRHPQAPWSCLTRLFLDEKLSDELGIHKELETFWKEVETFESHVGLAANLVAGFRTSRNRPESERFYRWLRLCGAHLEYPASGECHRLLRQISPAQGEDLLLMIDKHLEETSLPVHELEIIIHGLGHLATNGQPMRWKIEETRALPAYDVDFRQGAVFMLCRLVNSPNEELSRLAAQRLSRAASVVARTGDPHLIFRWRAGCRLGFGVDDADEYIPVPLLAVWTGDDEEQPRYSLKDAIERGDCKPREGHPSWTCGSSRWTGEGKPLQLALLDLFTHSRYIEWQDQQAPPEREVQSEPL
ncbi:MAG: hypothetical protein ACNA8W_03790 [Bradymonadaceae bacterium]